MQSLTRLLQLVAEQAFRPRHCSWDDIFFELRMPSGGGINALGQIGLGNVIVFFFNFSDYKFNSTRWTADAQDISAPASSSSTGYASKRGHLQEWDAHFSWYVSSS